MPFYDFACPACNWKGERLAPIGAVIDCPTCGTKTEKQWTTNPNTRFEDVTWAGGKTFENMGTHEPVTFYSPAEHKAFMKQQGIEPAVRHVPEKGSDKSRFTTRWVSVSPITEEERLKSWYEHEATLE